MAIDIRATVTCSLGTLISGSISDDYIQGSGLIKTRGSVEINALITPGIGTPVTFTYAKGGVGRNIPRVLRVLSFFADPFRRTTKVELGCKLTYLSDLKEPVDWTAFDDPENTGYVADDALIVTLPIYASSVMDKCLAELGITASSNPLTNKFSIAEFDFSAGYVSVLNDLLVSESYCGYLNTSEVLQVFELDQDASTGPVFTDSDIVDLGPIGVGQLPGEAVTVSYSTLKLKQPDPTDTDSSSDSNQRRRWELATTTTGPIFYEVGRNLYSGMEYTETRTVYKRIAGSDVPVNRVTRETASTAKIAGTIGTAYVNNGLFFNEGTAELRREEEIITYDDKGNRLKTDTTTYEQALSVFGSVSLPYVFSSSDYVVFNYVMIPSSRVVTTYDNIGGKEQTVSSKYLLWPLTIPGQQAVAEYRAELQTSAAVSEYVNRLAVSGLTHQGTTVSINTTDQIPGRPLYSINAAYAIGGDPNNGWRTESEAELELAVGSAAAQRRIEFSMPYAPDDTFSGPTGGPFTATASDAPAKANRYGRVQNRLLLGNRSGINLQLAPDKLPAAPYSPLYVKANGLTAMYRANGTNWAFDSNGIVCSVDALYWAAIGGTGTFWFPVAPGITTLPTTPPIVDTAPDEVIGTIATVGETPQTALSAAFPTATAGDGVQDQATGNFWVYSGSTWANVGQNPGPSTTATTTVLPYNETAIYDSLIHLTPVVTKFDYSLTLLTQVSSTISIPADAVKITPIQIPAVVSFAIAAVAPRIEPSIAVRVTTTPTVAIAATTPQVGSGIGLATVQPPSSSIVLAAPAPAFAVGSAISLLLHMDGTNGSTTFTDSSLNTLTATANGNAKISTAQSKFGGASGLFDGNGDYLSYAYNAALDLISSNFTVEAWVYPTANKAGGMRVFAAGGGAVAFNNTNGIHFLVQLDSVGKLNFQSWTGSATQSQLYTTALSLSAWSHIAVSVSGVNVYLAVNGVVQTFTTSTLVRPSTNPIFTIGTINGEAGGTSTAFVGNIDDVRVTKGVAWYTADFTPPTAAFPDP